ncbi:hypothetical protein MBLNU457_6618t1 [Dothideomycetes sp. NU457]
MDPVSPSLSGRSAPFRPRRSRDIDLDLVSNLDTKNEIATRIAAPHTQQSRIITWRPASAARPSNSHNAHHALSDPPASSQSAQAIGADSSVRRKSIRNVVRKMFGRRVKQDHLPRQPLVRHGYHKSDPGILLPVNDNQTQSLHQFSAPTSPKRVVSVPVHLNDQAGLRQIKSPNAVEFPQSARLKPLQLEGPFYQSQSSGLRRRASLPSFLMVETAQGSPSVEPSNQDREGVPPLPPLADTTGSDIGVALTSATVPKRRSRSADDFRPCDKHNGPDRDKAEAIEYWRESYTGSALRNSFLDQCVPPIEEQKQISNEVCEDSILAGERTESYPLQSTARPDNSDKPSRKHDSPILSRPVTARGHDETDLLDRIYYLERELNASRAEVERLTNENKRRSTLSDSTPRQIDRRNSPSALIEDLQERELDNQYCSANNPPARTFTALYKMLSDERFARRELESQVRQLAQDLAEFKYQLSRPIITRESPIYMPRPQRQLHHSQIYNSRYTQDSTNMDDSQSNALTSRFSGSTEASRRESQRRDYIYDHLRDYGDHVQEEEEDEELQTPNETHQTPIAEFRTASEWPKRQTLRSDDGMF